MAGTYAFAPGFDLVTLEGTRSAGLAIRDCGIMAGIEMCLRFCKNWVEFLLGIETRS